MIVNGDKSQIDLPKDIKRVVFWMQNVNLKESMALPL